jgi:hypothetical protein
MGNKFCSSVHAQWSFHLDVGAEPDPKFHNPLKLFCVVVPTVIVAEGMGRKVVVNRMVPARAMGENMVGIPGLAIDCPAADVTATASFAQNLGSLGFGEGLSWRPGVTQRIDAAKPLGMKLGQVVGEGVNVGECLVSGHG